MIKAIVSLVFVIFWVWYFLGGGLEKGASKEMHNVENQVASDAVQK
jgi:hypothetical protein